MPHLVEVPFRDLEPWIWHPDYESVFWLQEDFILAVMNYDKDGDLDKFLASDYCQKNYKGDLEVHLGKIKGELELWNSIKTEGFDKTKSVFTMEVTDEGRLKVHDGFHRLLILNDSGYDGNIMINMENVVKILDFGLAKLLPKEDITKPRAILGTVPYMSPEQTAGKLVDYRTDIWSLGVVMYRMLTGKHPFRGRNVSEMIRSIATDEPKAIRELRPDVPESLELCIQKMMEKNRRDRHENMRDVIRALKSAKPHP